MITIHITLAILSILSVSYTALIPSKTRLLITHLLTAGALASGITAAFIYPINFGKVCLSGAAYLLYIIITLKIAGKKLATRET